MEKQTSFLESVVSHKSNTPELVKNKCELFVDGAARGNPGPAGAGIYIRYSDSNCIKKGFYLGEKTNNQAEYLALAIGLHLILKKDNHPKSVQIYSDSELLVKQMHGSYRVKNPNLLKIKTLIDDMLQDVNYKIKHVLRAKNKTADAMANEGIDKKNKIPESFLSLMKNI